MSFDSGRPINSHARYESVADKEYQAAPVAQRKGSKKWLVLGAIAAIIIVGAAVGLGVGLTRNKSSSDKSSSGSSGSPGDASSAINAKSSVGRFATGTDPFYLYPDYPSTTNTAVYTSPTFVNSDDANLAWPSDSFQPANPQPTNVRTDRPRIIAPSYKWQALPNLIAHDPYLKGWNDSIFQNATEYFSLPPVVYHMDGSSGILDNSREIKMRIKAFSYCYRMTNDTKWSDRAWTELQNAAGNGTTPFGPDTDKWNSGHFLDTAEMTAAFAYGYDWLHDVWTDDQLASLRSTMITFGLSFGVQAYTNMNFGWWSNDIQGNWNCVCNSGLTMGALAIIGEDTTGTAEQILGLSIPNAQTNCVFAVSSDGTWSETANYWYFGMTGLAEMASTLQTATGSDFGMLAANPNLNKTGEYHMYVTGQTSLFDYGDHGPNKFSTTANSMIYLGDQLNNPAFVLFQRDMHDAPEPNSMFWYDPTVSGAFWDGNPLDMFFDNSTDQWAAMRSSWTDRDALYVAIKAGMLQGHQTHNDLDAGDFVLDALDTRWAGELGSGDYLSTGYFSSDAQDSQRWLYYRKRTEGQNTILVNGQNQNVNAQPTVKHDSSGTAQGSSTVETIPSGSTAFWIADLVSAYNDTSSFSRGMRLINDRKQVLLQDEITSTQALQWRMHTNATVTVNSNGFSLAIGDKNLEMQILNAPSGIQLGTAQPVRLSTDPALPAGQTDQPNPGVTVVTIDMPAGTYNLQVLFNPQWPGMSSSDFQTPPSVALADWTLTSHN
ncbi:hypothetical protein SCHPADRAFT_863609 [Schizopora paradoxa]|uniref:Heparinase II/III-like C-terminal domain-containing protein n=1 Tax=Schizopora paradoxa TaxID=27342 RepID=A0A0H2SA78_9AGAM|nr:hypothetical protein SCHPADRAFT_863609 [Schizopora paradoxa]